MTLFRIIPAGDVDLNEDGTLPDLLEGANFVRQRLSIKFKFFLAEWFLNRREGIPYYRDVLVKNPDIELIRALFIDVIRSEPMVARIPSLDLIYDARERLLSFAFIATLTNNEQIIVTPNDEDFILSLPQVD